MDKITEKSEVSPSEVLKTISDEEELNGMAWSTDTNAVSIPVHFHEDSRQTVPSYLVEPVSTSEVREALDIIQTFQNNAEDASETQNQSCQATHEQSYSADAGTFVSVGVECKDTAAASKMVIVKVIRPH